MYKRAVKCNECGKLICIAWRTLFLSMDEDCCPKCGQVYSSFSLDGSVGNAEGFSIVKVIKKSGFLNWLFGGYEEVERNVREA